MKYKDPIRMPNHTRLLITSNHDWVVPAALGERRFITLTVKNESHRNDRGYFGAILAELDAGGYGALLRYLLAFDWRAGEPWELPATEALAEQKESSLGSVIAFLLAITHDATLFGDHKGEGITDTDVMHREYISWCRDHGHRRPESKDWLFRRMNEFLVRYDASKITRFGRYSDREFPPLTELRAAFVAALGPIPWDDDHGSWQPEGPNR
jgi:hypothetical protein